jgi:hypothetical protein
VFYVEQFMSNAGVRRYGMYCKEPIVCCYVSEALMTAIGKIKKVYLSFICM